MNPLSLLVTSLPLWLAVGACVGSFLSVVHWRVPQMLRARAQGLPAPCTLNSPPSSCTCGRPLRLHENVPFAGFAWVKLRHGKTPCCAAPLHWRYLAFEVAGTAWAAVAWLAFDGALGATLLVGVLGWLALGLVSVALRYRSIRDQ